MSRPAGTLLGSSYATRSVLCRGRRASCSSDHGPDASGALRVGCAHADQLGPDPASSNLVKLLNDLLVDPRRKPLVPPQPTRLKLRH